MVRLGVPELLRRTLATTNPIESAFSVAENVTRPVERDPNVRWQRGSGRNAAKRDNTRRAVWHHWKHRALFPPALSPCAPFSLMRAWPNDRLPGTSADGNPFPFVAIHKVVVQSRR